MQEVNIYLSGSVQKGKDDTNRNYWTKEDMEVIRTVLDGFKVNFLNPCTRGDDLSDTFATFGRDMTQVVCSDVVMVDARERRGLGVGAEMMAAKMHHIPVVSIAPLGSHYHRKDFVFMGQAVGDWLHPFVETLSDASFENVQDAAQWVKTFAKNPSHVKDAKVVPQSIAHYLTTQLSRDDEMRTFIEGSDILKKRTSAFLEQ